MGGLCCLALAVNSAAAHAVEEQVCQPPHFNPGCQVILAPCNSSDVSQTWNYTAYSSANENSLALAARSDGQGNPLCLNVVRSGKNAGDDVWVTGCVPEHPDHANRHWEFVSTHHALQRGRVGNKTGKLKNVGSGFCALETPPQHSPEAPGYTVLADCAKAPTWTFEPRTGLIRSATDSSSCLSVDFDAVQPGPAPPGPPAAFGDVRDRLGCQLPGHTQYPFCNTSKSIAERAADLVARIKDEDKPGILTARANKALPYLGVPGYYYGTNCLHSAIIECVSNHCPTSFPAAPNWAATFDTKTMAAMAATVGKELRAAFVLGVPDNTHSAHNVGLQCWGPVVALNRDARWGRNGEGGVEDPRLAGAYGAAWSRGLQTGPPKANGVGHYLQAVATLKHFDAQTVEDSDGWSRHNVSANVSRYMLMDSYLPAFGIAIRAGAKGIMCSYNALNMTPTCLSPLLRAARVEWGFEKNGGYVTSDTDAVGDAYQKHHYVSSAAAASCEAIVRGGDQVNSGSTFQHGLLDGVKSGLCTMNDVDSAVMVVMKMRLELGLFDPVEAQPLLQYGVSDIGTTAAEDLNLVATQRSLILLKDGDRISGSGRNKTIFSRTQESRSSNLKTILPLATGVHTFVTGPHFNASWVLVQPDSGDVCPSGGVDCIPTPVHQITKFNKDGQTTGALGSYLLSDSDPKRVLALRTSAVAQARGADQIVLVLGIRSSGYLQFSCTRKRRPGHEQPVCKRGGRAGGLVNFTDRDGPYGNVMRTSNSHSVTDGDAFIEAETHDRRHIDLPQIQQELAIAIVALNKPTAIVLINGGSVALPDVIVRSSNVAIIESGYPGTRGSEAIASALFASPVSNHNAKVSSSYIDRFGRLPYSILKQSWTDGNKMDQMDLTVQPGRTYKYLNDPAATQFEFGAGLQLSRLTLHMANQLQLQPKDISSTDILSGANHTYSLILTNPATSRYKAEAVVMMFASPQSLPSQPSTHPLLGQRQLVSFRRVGADTALAPGESRNVRFSVSAQDLSIVDFAGSGNRVLAPGVYKLDWESGSDDGAVRGLPLRVTGKQLVVEQYPQAK